MIQLRSIYEIYETWLRMKRLGITSEMQRLISVCSNQLLFSFHVHSEAGIEKGPADIEKQIYNPVP